MNNTKVVIFGSTGQLGIAILLYFLEKKINCFSISKSSSLNVKSKFLYKHLSNTHLDKKLFSEIKNFGPTHIINCISLKKNHFDKYNYLIRDYLKIPIKISNFCIKNNIKFINFSTDIVFNGSKGNYTEAHQTDPINNYAKIKLKAEKRIKSCLNLRLSVIAYNPIKNNGFVDWILNTSKPIQGYSNYIFSGLTSIEISRILLKIIKSKKFVYGIYHLSGNKISKFNLIKLIIKIYKKKNILLSNNSLNINVSLNGKKLKNIYFFRIKSYKKQLIEMKEFFKKYEFKR